MKILKEDLALEDFIVAIKELYKYKIVILLIMIWGGIFGATLAIITDTNKTYTGVATVYSSNFSFEEIQASEAIVNVLVNYSDIVTSMKVCERAAALLNDKSITFEDIQDMVSISFNNSSYILLIYAKSTSEEDAINVANALAEAFVIETSNITGTEVIQVLDRASKLNVSSSNDMVKMIIEFAILASVVTILIIGGTVLFSNKLRSIGQWDGEIIGVIPYSYEEEVNKNIRI